MRKCFCILGLAYLTASNIHGQDLGIRQYLTSTVILTSGDTLTGSLVHYIEKDIIIVKAPDQLPRTLSASMVQKFTTNASITPAAESVTNVYKRYGDMSHNASNSIVYEPVESPSKITTSSPVFLEGVKYDALDLHNYISLPWPKGMIHDTQDRFGFFELLIPGKVVVLQRETPRLLDNAARLHDYYPPVGAKNANISDILNRNSKATHMYREVDNATSSVTSTTALVGVLYVIDLQGKIRKVAKGNKSNVLQLFPDKKEALQEYVRSERMSWNNIYDVIKVIEYGNTLQK